MDKRGVDAVYAEYRPYMTDNSVEAKAFDALYEAATPQSAPSAALTPKDAQHEPDWPGMETVRVSFREPSMVAHEARDGCNAEAPHTVASCGLFAPSAAVDESQADAAWLEIMEERIEECERQGVTFGLNSNGHARLRRIAQRLRTSAPEPVTDAGGEDLGALLVEADSHISWCRHRHDPDPSTNPLDRWIFRARSHPAYLQHIETSKARASLVGLAMDRIRDSTPTASSLPEPQEPVAWAIMCGGWFPGDRTMDVVHGEHYGAGLARWYGEAGYRVRPLGFLDPD